MKSEQRICARDLSAEERAVLDLAMTAYVNRDEAKLIERVPLHQLQTLGRVLCKEVDGRRSDDGGHDREFLEFVKMVFRALAARVEHEREQMRIQKKVWTTWLPMGGFGSLGPAVLKVWYRSENDERRDKSLYALWRTFCEMSHETVWNFKETTALAHFDFTLRWATTSVDAGGGGL